MWWPAGRSKRGLIGGLAWLLCIGILVSMTIEVGSSAIPPPTSAAAAAPPHATLVVSTRAKLRGNLHLDPFFDSKRRVPNGPDPIHNRREGKSGRPPGTA